MKKTIFGVNDTYHGFTVVRIRDMDELDGCLVEMTHDATGAKLIWVDNGAENKLFSVGFKTLPEDNTGVFHILEHSVLCGSEKFPVKEPFVELLKTSMNTFLNAMTYPDKTLYPVSSRVRQDYLNLMEVYLDAVFRPNILNNPNIFYQEGWHIDTTEGEPAFKGVVFNEMKGAMSDVDQLAERSMMKLLFPDTCYGYNSGGDPDAIVDLSYEKFIETYRRYYHPSNSYFYLDGDIPVEETFSMIESYLADFEPLHVLPRIVMQNLISDRKVIEFDASEGDEKGVVVCGRIVGTWEDRDRMLALSVLLEQLADSNESPLKRAVLSTGLAEDMEIFVADGTAQPYLMMIFRGVEDSVRDAQKLIAAACDAVKEASSKGFARRDLEASINLLDFRFREYPEPQALYRANAAYASWLYGGDPAIYLASNEAISNLRRMADDGEFESLAVELMGDRFKYSVLSMSPDAELGRSEAEAEAKFVRASIEAMDETGRRELEELNKVLLTWQQTPDSDENIARIPTLELSDIDSMPEILPSEVREVTGREVLFHQISSNGIVYINAYFPITQLGLEDLPAAALITELYKNLPTENYDVLSLQNEIRMYTGFISFDIDIMAKDGDRESCTPCIRVRASALEDKLPYAEDLIVEILTKTGFDDKTLIRELITQIDEEAKRSAVSAGHRLALLEAKSHWSARDAANEALNGYSFMQYMHAMNGCPDEELKKFSDFAADVIASSINKSNLKISVTSSEFADISHLIETLPDGITMPESAHYESSLPKRMGIQLPSAVSYAVTAYDMGADEFEMNGHMAVAANIVSLAQLWNEIRVQGGAYGASMSAGRTGGLFCYTYRDPSPARSLGIYKTTSEFLSEFSSVDEQDIDGFIISSVASTEPLLSPGAKGRAADDYYYSGFSDENRIRFRSEMLSTTVQDLRDQCNAIDAMEEQGTVCVVGPKAALETCPDLETVDL